MRADFPQHGVNLNSLLSFPGGKNKNKTPLLLSRWLSENLMFLESYQQQQDMQLTSGTACPGKKKKKTNETPPTHTRPISYSVCRLPDSKHARCYVSGIRLTLTRLMMNNSNPLGYCQGFNSEHELVEPCKSQSGHFEALESTRARKQRYHNLLFNHVEFIRVTWLLIILYVLQSQ